MSVALRPPHPSSSPPVVAVQSDQIERLRSIGFAIQSQGKVEPETIQKPKFIAIFNNASKKRKT